MFGIGMLTVFAGFGVVLAAFYIIVLFINYLKDNKIGVRLALFDGERVENSIKVPHVTSREHLVVSNFRLAQLRASWFFSFKGLRVSDIDSCDSYRSFHLLNPTLLLCALWLVGSITPLGLALFLFSCVSFITWITYSFAFGGHKHRVHSWTAKRSASQRLRFFSLDTERLRRIAKNREKQTQYVDVSTSYLPSYDVTCEFTFSPYFKFLMAFYFVIAILQATVEQRVSYDSLVLFPAYLAAAVVAGSLMRPAQAFLTGFWGFWATFAISYPLLSGTLLSSYPSPGVSAFPHYLVIAGGLGLIALIASLASAHGWRFPEAAVLLWLPLVLVSQPENILDFSFLAKLALACLYASLGIWLVSKYQEDKAPINATPAVPPIPVVAQQGDRFGG